jgi:hypothetical protein
MHCKGIGVSSGGYPVASSAIIDPFLEFQKVSDSQHLALSSGGRAAPPRKGESMVWERCATRIFPTPYSLASAAGARRYSEREFFMTRKDSDKESERPHYYSQFWLDVAAGRRVIGTPRTGEEAEAPETEAPEPVISRKAGRAGGHEALDNHIAADGQTEAIVHPTAEPVAPAEEEEQYSEPEEEEIEEPVFDEEEPVYEEEAIAEEEPVADVVEDEDIPDMDLSPIDEEEDMYDEEEEEEDEDISWGRGRKKAKPGRQVKPPKRSRRDTRRGF